MRSVVVVFPASMCAMMPMLRIRSSGVTRGISSCLVDSAKTRGDRDARRAGRSRSAVIGGREPPRCRVPSAGSRSCRSKRLPPVMREGPIGLRHPVRVLFLLDRLALALRGEDQLGGEAFRHVLLAARAAVLDQPAHPERRAPL